MKVYIVYYQRYNECSQQRTYRADVEMEIKVLIWRQCQNRNYVPEEFLEGWMR